MALCLGSSFAFVPPTLNKRPQRQNGARSDIVRHNEQATAIDADFGEAATSRRVFMGIAGLAPLSLLVEPAEAKNNNRNSLFTVLQKAGTSTDALRTGIVDTSSSQLRSEKCLLKLLPVDNKVFRKLQSFIEALEALRSPVADERYWQSAHDTMVQALEYLDNQRRFLEPVFNQEDTTTLQIEKAERGERLIETLRDELVVLGNLTQTDRDFDTVFDKQKVALLALSDIGELLVGPFPYDVPTEGKFAYLPRLLGRCRVTLTFKRDNDFLGNVTFIADGFAAPITAGNFVDLSVRQFYTGLPVKAVTKKLGGLTSIRTGFLRFETVELEPEDEEGGATSAPISILGSYREGFYDPLTAKPRRIPLESVRFDKASGVSELTYARGFADISADEAVIDNYRNSKPVLSFDIPELVALNHPDKNVNGGSSEFFALQKDALPEEKRGLLDGQYAPFGYIIDGFDIYQSLREGDVIAATDVGKWGQLNLVKIKGSKFSDLAGKEGEEA